MFKILKNKFGFNPKLFNKDFNKACCKALKNYKNIHKYGLNNQDVKNELCEFLYNLKMLCFIDSNNISYYL